MVLRSFPLDQVFSPAPASPKKHVYLDYNACAPLYPQAHHAMMEALSFMGNPSSVHAWGRFLSNKIEHVRQSIAVCLNAKDQDVIFTSCGSEANNLFLHGLEQQGYCVLVGATEHASVSLAPSEPCHIPVTAQGLIRQEALAALLQEKKKEHQGPMVVSIQMANNETGVIQPLHEIVPLVKSYGALIHTDGIQALGRLENPLKA